jgi:hypothetical protein
MIQRSAGETSPTIAARDMYSLVLSAVPWGMHANGLATTGRQSLAGCGHGPRAVGGLLHSQDDGALRVRSFFRRTP